ncbi:hypothetical protein [Curtobacterium sp. MCPF17_052]|uniref:hypothetical protein n=1 Tax=Curtobacterium sp. MCPF17_052 TaxID=2175655 RepID=UPI0034646102
MTTGAVYRYDLTTVGDATEHDAGFRLTVPSGQGTRQLTLVGGIWQASADLTVATTDGATVQTSRLSAGGSAAVQRTTVTMRPGEGAVVTATLRTVAGRDGNVSFMGAALRSLDDGPQLTAGPTPQRIDLTAAGTSDWLHLDGATVDRSRDGDGSLGVVDRDPAGTIKQQGDNPTTYSWTNGVPTATQDGTRTGGVFLAPGDDATKPSGWDLTVRADRAPRTLQFVAGVWQASARLSVTLDDTAEPVLTDTGLTAGGSAVSHLYTLTIPAGGRGTRQRAAHRDDGVRRERERHPGRGRPRAAGPPGGTDRPGAAGARGRPGHRRRAERRAARGGDRDGLGAARRRRLERCRRPERDAPAPSGVGRRHRECEWCPVHLAEPPRAHELIRVGGGRGRPDRVHRRQLPPP